MRIVPGPLLLSVRVFFCFGILVISENLCLKSISLLFTFARIRSFQEIYHLGEDLVECLTKTVCIKKLINDATSNNDFTLENMRKCMDHMQLHSRDLLSDFYGPRNLSTKRGPGRLLLSHSLRFNII